MTNEACLTIKKTKEIEFKTPRRENHQEKQRINLIASTEVHSKFQTSPMEFKRYYETRVNSPKQ